MQDSLTVFITHICILETKSSWWRKKLSPCCFLSKKKLKSLWTYIIPQTLSKHGYHIFKTLKSYTHLPYPCLKHIMYILDCLNFFFYEWQSKEEVRNLSWWMLFLNFVNWICLYRAIKSAFSRSPVTSSYQVQWFTDSSCVLTSLLHLTLLLSGWSLDPCLLCHAYDPSSSPTRLMAPQILLRLSVSLCPLSPGMQPLEKDF